MRHAFRYSVPSLIAHLTLLFALKLFLAACQESSPVAPDPETEIDPALVQQDVESLVGGSLAGWWRANHAQGPSPTLSAAADILSSSWRNWGMLHVSQEPRQDFSTLTDPHIAPFVSEVPWTELYRTLVASRDALLLLNDGFELGEDGEDTRRAMAYARFTQGLALGTLAQLFDAAWILDETVDPAEVGLSPYPDVLAAALESLDRAIALAEGGAFTLPSEWVGFDRALDQDELARLARSWKARFRLGVARGPGERAAVDWSAVLDDVRAGITEDWAGRYNGDHETNWAWEVRKLIGSNRIWGRLDYRLIGPADASGAWREWMATPPSARMPFVIDTDDSRITGGSPTADGTYVTFEEQIFFQPQRGTTHFSFYVDRRWAHLFEQQAVGRYPNFPVKELEFIEAEALYRLGDLGGAMAIVNRWRANGNLPAFTNPQGPAPGSERCVPRRDDGVCDDLWGALRYEKLLELFHYGAFTGYTDRRGWGDLQPGTVQELLRPDLTLGEVLAEIYGTSDTAAALALARTRSVQHVRQKVEGIQQFDSERNLRPGDFGAG